MDCQFSFLCDYAAQERKLYAIGIGWDTLFAPSLPHTHPMMCYVAKIGGSIAESGVKDVVLRLIDADGVDVIPELHQQLPFEVKPPNLVGAVQLVMVLSGLQISKYGAYAIHLVIQGVELDRVSFNVTKPPTTA